MRIFVTKVDTSTEDVIINFSSEYGEAEGFWGTKPIPKPNNAYDVELDISDELYWVKDVKLSKDKKFIIGMQEDVIILTGILEKAYKDGIADFHIGKSLIQLELNGKSLPLGSYITISCSSLEIYEITK